MSDAAGGAVSRRRARSVAIAVLFLVVLPLLVLGWQTQSDSSATPAGAADVSGPDLLRAIELPRAAQDARAAGIDEPDLVASLTLLQGHGVSAADAREVFSAYLRLGLAARGEALAPHLEERLDAGVPGTALAEALRPLSRALPPPDSSKAAGTRPRLQVPRDSAGERRPLRDTGQLPPPPPGEGTR